MEMVCERTQRSQERPITELTVLGVSGALWGFVAEVVQLDISAGTSHVKANRVVTSSFGKENRRCNSDE